MNIYLMFKHLSIIYLQIIIYAMWKDGWRHIVIKEIHAKNFGKRCLTRDLPIPLGVQACLKGITHSAESNYTRLTFCSFFYIIMISKSQRDSSNYGFIFQYFHTSSTWVSNVPLRVNFYVFEKRTRITIFFILQWHCRYAVL